MAIDTTGNLAARLAQYLSNTTQIDTNQVVNIINDFLPAGQTVDTIDQGISTGVYKRLGPNDIVTAKNEVVTTGLWANNTGSLTSFFTSSTQQAASSSNYYTDVYHLDPSNASSERQFSIAYGHINGYGAPSLANSDSSTLPTKATYTQYRNLLLDPSDNYFTVVTGSSAGTTDINDIFVINVSRARYKEKLDPGNWQLNLSGSGGGIIKLIDDSGKKLNDTVGRAGRVFYIASGSLNLGQVSASLYSTSASNGQGYGLFYPDAGIFILNPAALSASFSWITPSATVTTYAKNQNKLLAAITGGADFQARSTENVSSNHYFIRANNREFNFSNNPTFVTGSIGKFKQQSFEGDPKVYPTTVGLYNDANELIAVAKLSQPTKKSFDREVHIKVKVDF